MHSISTTVSFIYAFICAFALSACVGAEPKKEWVQLDLDITAAACVNPDDRGRATPIMVRIYELKNDGLFNTADFFTLHDKEKTVLAHDVLKRDEYQLRPGERQVIKRKADPAATAIGVLAAYRDLPNSVWRAVYAMPEAPDTAWYRFSTPKLKLKIHLDTDAIHITETKK